MAYLFLLLFFVCIFGLFKPFKGVKRWQFGLAAFVAFILVGVAAPDPSSEQPTMEEAPPLPSKAEAEEAERRNAQKIANLKRQVSDIPSGSVEANLEIYKQLSTLAPANAEFADKVEYYEAKLAARARYSDNPEEALEIADMDWSKGGFDSIMIIDRLTVRNDAPFAIKDFVVKCTHQGPSGTDMDSNARKVYEIVPAGGNKTVREVNMGFIHSQAVTSRCEIVSAMAG